MNLLIYTKITFRPYILIHSWFTFLFQLLITASDKGFPVRRAQATVRVKIIRDTETLDFNLLEYDITISENKPVGENIILVAASPGVGLKLKQLSDIYHDGQYPFFFDA